MSLLVLDRIRAGYGAKPDVLRSVSLTVEQGERIAVVSSNGAGKTTLLRVAAGLLKPRSGTVDYTGKSNPAFLFQVPRQQLVCGTVREEVEYTLKLNGTSNVNLNTQASDILARFDLSELADRAPHALSGGQQQKVVLAASLARAPELLLLDEVDSYLDGKSRREFRAFFFGSVKSATIWAVSRPSELPADMKAFVLKDGVLLPYGQP